MSERRISIALSGGGEMHVCLPYVGDVPEATLAALKQIGEAAIRAMEQQVTGWRDIPVGLYAGANRYATDDEEVLSLWAAGTTVDVRENRELTRIKAEALDRVRHAFYTDGALGRLYGGQSDEFKRVYDAVFEDVMLVAEPGKAEAELARRDRASEEPK